MKHSTRQCHAFSLVEVTLALGIAAVCLITLFALIPASLTTDHATLEQTVDTNWARLIASDLRATPANSSVSPRFQISIPSTGIATHTIFLQEDGTATPQDTDATAAQNPKYRATITFTAPANSNQKTATSVTILLTWPGLADKTASTTPTKFTGSYEVFTAVSRN